jgi:hypothetical protein
MAEKKTVAFSGKLNCIFCRKQEENLSVLIF